MSSNDSGSEGAVEVKKVRRGFSAMTPEKQRELARMGGRAAHESGKRPSWTSDQAKAAGSKGGIVAQRRRREREAAEASREEGQ